MAINIGKNSDGDVTYANPPVNRVLFPNITEYATPEAIEAFVNAWLDDHPEATTTVKDGSILPVKLDSTNSASDGYVLSYNATEGKFEWYDVGGELDEINSDITDLKQDLSDLTQEEYTNLFHGLTYTDQWYVDPLTGEGSSNAAFFSYLNVIIPDGVKFVYPYNDFGGDVPYIRGISFYDANGDYISGVSGQSSYVNNGVAVPNNAVTLNASLAYSRNQATKTPGTHYLSTVYGNPTYQSLNSGIIVNGKNVDGTVFNNNIRIPAINFQFDDGHANDADIVDIFKDKGLTCGFAIIANSSADALRYYEYQGDGFEILSHSIDTQGMNDATVSASTIEEKLKTSKEYLESKGFNVKGFVTPNSTMADVFKPLLRKYYQFATTKYFGTAYTGTGLPYQTPVDGCYNVFRISLEGTTLANQKAAVDACIDNYGCLSFYGHSSMLDTTNNLTTENLEALLDYINDKISAEKCICGNPSDVIRNYFAVRNDDISDGWVPVTATDVSLDSRFTTVSWSMLYNDKLKLISFTIRLKATESISGQITPILTFPRRVIEGNFVPNDANRICITYNNGLLLTGSGTWSEDTSYRFSGMFHIN